MSAWMVVVVAGQSLGCSDTFSDELVTKLVAENFGAGTLAVRLENEPNGYRFQVVCLAGPAGETRHYTHASLVVFHSVNASKAVYGQYEFECDLQGVNGAPLTWSSGFLGSFLGTSGADNRLVPLTRPPPYSLRPAVNCVACVNPAHSLGGSRANADPVSHCVGESDFVNAVFKGRVHLKNKAYTLLQPIGTSTHSVTTTMRLYTMKTKTTVPMVSIN